MKPKLVGIIFIFIQITGFAQDYEWQPTKQEVEIIKNDSVYRANILIKKENIQPKQWLEYFWHYKGELKSNVGGYAGEVLHGGYKVFDKNSNLIVQGQFEKGLKAGVWRYWNEKGRLIRLESYKSGVLHGPVTLFDAAGRELEKQYYKEGERIKEKKERNSLFKRTGDNVKNDSVNVKEHNTSDKAG